MSNISNQTLLCGYAFPDPSTTKPETLKLQNTEEVPEELLKVQILETITRFSDSLGGRGNYMSVKNIYLRK